MAIKPLYNRLNLDKQLSQTPPQTLFVFVSRHAIHYAGPSLNKALEWPYLTCVCLGPGSQQALLKYGIAADNIIAPHLPPYETESLLAHPFFSSPASNNKLYWIFRGPPGRTLLQDTLSNRGNTIQETVLYDRTATSLTPELKIQWKTALNNHNVTLASSAEGLHNLIKKVEQLSDKSLEKRLLDQPILLPSTRVSQLAKSYGFRYITKTGSLETQSLLNALKALFP